MLHVSKIKKKTTLDNKFKEITFVHENKLTIASESLCALLVNGDWTLSDAAMHNTGSIICTNVALQNILRWMFSINLSNLVMHESRYFSQSEISLSMKNIMARNKPWDKDGRTILLERYHWQKVCPKIQMLITLWRWSTKCLFKC